MMTLKYITPYLFIFTSLLVTACAQPDAVKVSGSTTVLPAISTAAEQYSTRAGQLIFVNAGGSGGGFSQLAEGRTDIGMMSRDITQGERQAFEHIAFTTIAIGRDAVVPAVSSEIYNAGVTTLSLEQVGDIYAGRITNWSEVGGPETDIFVVDKEVSRGTRQVFMSIVAGDPKALAPGADLVTGSNNEEQTALIQSDAAIGMLSHAWLNDDVKGVSIKLNGAVIAPTLANISLGDYPITRDLNIILRGDVSIAAKGFANYLLSKEGQKHVTAAGYVSVIE